MSDTNEKIDFHVRLMHLFTSLNDLRVLDTITNRERINTRAKDVIQCLNILRLTNVNFEVWKDFKDLRRDLPSHVIDPHIPELENLKKLIAKPTKEKIPMSFEALFKDPDNAKKVKDIFEIHVYTSNGKWTGLSNNKTELLAAYHILKPLLKPGKVTPQATIFYNEFGLIVGEYITSRSLTIEPLNNDTEEFQGIFKEILSSK